MSCSTKLFKLAILARDPKESLDTKAANDSYPPFRLLCILRGKILLQ